MTIWNELNPSLKIPSKLVTRAATRMQIKNANCQFSKYQKIVLHTLITYVKVKLVKNTKNVSATYTIIIYNFKINKKTHILGKLILYVKLFNTQNQLNLTNNFKNISHIQTNHTEKINKIQYYLLGLKRYFVLQQIEIFTKINKLSKLLHQNAGRWSPNHAMQAQVLQLLYENNIYFKLNFLPISICKYNSLNSTQFYMQVKYLRYHRFLSQHFLCKIN
eukprot:TRINITY_DN10754_c0_g2_i1.p1 TRINITY_DN10754_c0_g2~~TRINITY_DN10754_c0_g2_i1.p1  ORF type:complete len:219 (-),score=-11.95 TRINITY_DN10754_c0_g2_i1:300-956(-)